MLCTSPSPVESSEIRPIVSGLGTSEAVALLRRDAKHTMARCTDLLSAATRIEDSKVDGHSAMHVEPCRYWAIWQFPKEPAVETEPSS